MNSSLEVLEVGGLKNSDWMRFIPAGLREAMVMLAKDIANQVNYAVQ